MENECEHAKKAKKVTSSILFYITNCNMEILKNLNIKEVFLLSY